MVRDYIFMGNGEMYPHKQLEKEVERGCRLHFELINMFNNYEYEPYEL